MREARRYLRVAAATIAVAVLASIGLTVAVDPYRCFGTPAVPGLTEGKPRAEQRAEMAKTYMLERVRPRTLLLGNSRMEVGLDPDSSAWPARCRPVFNAALAGHDLRAAGQLFREALADGSRPALVMLGLDFQDFIAAPADAPDPPPDDEDGRLRVDARGHANRLRPLQAWADILHATLTLGAVTDSLLTLLDQSRDEPTMTPDGFDPLREYAAFARREGYRRLFDQKDRVYRSEYARFAPRDFARPMRNVEFRILSGITDAAVRAGVPLALITYPYHRHYLDMLHDLGLWRSFEDWKRAVLRMAGARDPGGELVRVYDFARYDEATTEPVPAQGDRRGVMRWYWEAGHFKSALGDRIIARVTPDDAACVALPPPGGASR